MASGRWKSPLYSYKWGSLVIDVTSSISAGLGAHRSVKSRFIPALKQAGFSGGRVVDFGAGALRHTLSLLSARFEVCAVEFQEAFKRPEAALARGKAEKNPHFSTLLWPDAFVNHSGKFDAALLTYVLQVMPEAAERNAVVKALSKKIADDGLLLYMSRVGQLTPDMRGRPLKDGFWMWPDRERHSFYREFSLVETDKLMERHGFDREASWSEGGKEQVLLYRKVAGPWG